MPVIGGEPTLHCNACGREIPILLRPHVEESGRGYRPSSACPESPGKKHHGGKRRFTRGSHALPPDRKHAREDTDSIASGDRRGPERAADFVLRLPESFVVDTDSYAGNFERELSSFVVGRCDDYGEHRGGIYKEMYEEEVPENLKSVVEDLVELRINDPGDDGIMRAPMDLAPTPAFVIRRVR